MEENRKYKRVQRELDVSISDDNLFEYDEVSSVNNISSTGIQVKSPKAVGVGKIRTLSIQTPDNAEPMNAVVKVVWEKKDGDIFVIGLKFLDITEEQFNHIDKFLYNE